MKLRKLENKDIPFMLEWMHDNDINKFFLGDFNRFDESRVQKFIAESISDENQHYACVNDEDVYLGTISLKNIDYNAKNAEYAISFRKDAHGTGASQFATREILKYAFERLELERVYLNVINKNVRAIKFYEKMGFVYEGTFRNHVLINHELENLRWYGILKREYMKGREL